MTMNSSNCWRLANALCVLLVAVSPSRAAGRGDTRTFDLTLVAPPTPALKYELLFDPIDQTTGNAADFYKQAKTLMTDKLNTEVIKAMDASDARNVAALAAIDADLADKAGEVFDLLDKAARCDHCDWQSHLRENGITTLLPYLNYSREMANLIYIHATAQLDAGKPEDALMTLRLGYALGRNAGSEQTLVNGLVSVGIESLMNSGLSQVMSSATSPNLYWALAGLPSCKEMFCNSMTGERYMPTVSIPLLQEARRRDLTAAEWQQVWNDVSRFTVRSKGGLAQQPKKDSSVPIAYGDLLPAAQLYYSQTRNIPLDNVAKLDPIEVVGPFYFEHYEQIQDDVFKLVNLPYPAIQARLILQLTEVKQLKESEPGNLLVGFIPSFNRPTETFARTDRNVAALLAVEAIRSYATANNGQLPQHLADITDTPVQDNPRTGKPFDYVVSGDTATLSDAEPAAFPLRYTIRIRH